MEVGLRTQISSEKLESIELEIEGLQTSLEKERNRIRSEIKDLVHSKGFKKIFLLYSATFRRHSISDKYN